MLLLLRVLKWGFPSFTSIGSWEMQSLLLTTDDMLKVASLIFFFSFYFLSVVCHYLYRLNHHYGKIKLARYLEYGWTNKSTIHFVIHDVTNIFHHSRCNCVQFAIWLCNFFLILNNNSCCLLLIAFLIFLCKIYFWYSYSRLFFQAVVLPDQDTAFQDMDMFHGNLVLFLRKKGLPLFCSIDMPIVDNIEVLIISKSVQYCIYEQAIAMDVWNYLAFSMAFT